MRGYENIAELSSSPQDERSIGIHPSKEVLQRRNSGHTEKERVGVNMHSRSKEGLVCHPKFVEQSVHEGKIIALHVLHCATHACKTLAKP